MNPQDEDRDTLRTSAYDPFPQPQTIPSGWDTSGFFSDPRPAPVTEAADAAEAGAQEKQLVSGNYCLPITKADN